MKKRNKNTAPLNPADFSQIDFDKIAKGLVAVKPKPAPKKKPKKRKAKK